MVAPRYRSRSFRKVSVRTPGGKTTIHYTRRNHTPATCAVTGEKLHGVPRNTPYKLKELSKTQRRPERPYGGVLSSKAMRALLKAKVRQK